MKSPPTLPTGPRRLKMQDVPAYVLKRHRLRVTRQTVYNWLKAGRSLDSLQWENVPNTNKLHRCSVVKVTRTDWVDDFLARTVRA